MYHEDRKTCLIRTALCIHQGLILIFHSTLSIIVAGCYSYRKSSKRPGTRWKTWGSQPNPFRWSRCSHAFPCLGNCHTLYSAKYMKETVLLTQTVHELPVLPSTSTSLHLHPLNLTAIHQPHAQTSHHLAMFSCVN